MLKFLILLALVLPIAFFFKNIRLADQTGKMPSPQGIPAVTATPVFVPKVPDIEQIFAPNHSLPDNLNREQIIVFLATGDIIPSRSVNFQTTTRQIFNWPYEMVAGGLKNADIIFANLETPLIEKCPVTQEGMVFCGDKKNIEGLKYAGVDVVNLANNHAGNFGKEGVLETVQYLSEAGILATGMTGPVYKDTKGLKFAFLGYNDVGIAGGGLAQTEEEIIKQEIAEAKSKAAIVVVTFHWGIEYMSQPSPRQKELAHLAIDNGADLIIGNHPHWIQPVEIYQKKFITYAHGNFVFDQMWSQKTKEGVVGKYTFYISSEARNSSSAYGKSLIDVEFLPIQIDNFGQPHFVEGIQKEKILNEMKQESLKLIAD